MVDPIEHHALLNSVAKEVSLQELSSDFIQGVIDQMFYVAAGKGHSKEDSRQVVGLAAPQVGIGKRIMLIDLTANGANQDQNLVAVINPVLSNLSDQTIPGREGCWSCGNVCGNVQRSASALLSGFDRSGEKLSLPVEGFVARIAQHEVDHLNGIRFPDRIPVDEPEKLHWVEHAQFEDYRAQWEHWPVLCPREKWEELKAGRQKVL